MNFTYGLKNNYNSCSGQRDRTLAMKSLLKTLPTTKTVPLTVESCKLKPLPFLSLYDKVSILTVEGFSVFIKKCASRCRQFLNLVRETWGFPCSICWMDLSSLALRENLHKLIPDLKYTNQFCLVLYHLFPLASTSLYSAPRICCRRIQNHLEFADSHPDDLPAPTLLLLKYVVKLRLDHVEVYNKVST
jgi:hypothetical protein